MTALRSCSSSKPSPYRTYFRVGVRTPSSWALPGLRPFWEASALSSQATIPCLMRGSFFTPTLGPRWIGSVRSWNWVNLEGFAVVHLFECARLRVRDYFNCRSERIPFVACMRYIPGPLDIEGANDRPTFGCQLESCSRYRLFQAPRCLIDSPDRQQ
jgi:hypothetical protein